MLSARLHLSDYKPRLPGAANVFSYASEPLLALRNMLEITSRYRALLEWML